MGVIEVDQGGRKTAGVAFETPLSLNEFGAFARLEQDPQMFEWHRVHTQAFLQENFSIHIQSPLLSPSRIAEVQLLETNLKQIEAISRGPHEQFGIPRAALLTAQMTNTMNHLGNSSLIYEGTIQSQFNGKIDLNSESRAENMLGGILFYLAHRKPNFEQAKSMIEASSRALAGASLSWKFWDELAEKMDTYMHRLGDNQAAYALRFMPPIIRLLAYGDRMRIPYYERNMLLPDDEYGHHSTYYEDAQRQAEDVTIFDTLLYTLKQKDVAKSKERSEATLWQIMRLPFFDPDVGVFRPRDPAMKAFENSTHRAVTFLLTAAEGVGIDAMAQITSFVGGLQLKGRASMGGIPTRLRENVERIVGEESHERKDAFAELVAYVERTSDNIG